MGEFTSILDKIKKKYIQINAEKYERIINLLGFIWEEFKQILKIAKVENNNYKLYIRELLNFYDPKKNPATRIKIIEKLPIKDKIFENKIINEAALIELLEFEVIYLIKRTNNEHLLLTPEGLIFYFALLKSKRYDDIYRLNTLLIQNYEKLLIQRFRDFIFEKLNLFQTKKEGTSLNYTDIGILLFFLVNGSIDKERAFTREDLRSERALNCVVQAFHRNKNFDEEDRTHCRIRVLQSDISLLQSKIGYVIHNEKSLYFLKSEDLSYLLKVLKDNFKKKESEEIISRWDAFLKEYDYWRPLLRQNNICYYDKFEVKKLEAEILNISK